MRISDGSSDVCSSDLFWLAGAGRVRGSRFFFILLGVAVVGILAVIFFGADSNKRGMPPQANMEAPPSVPPPTPAPAAGTVPTAPPSFDVVRLSRNCTAVFAGRALPDRQSVV